MKECLAEEGGVVAWTLLPTCCIVELDAQGAEVRACSSPLSSAFFARVFFFAPAARFCLTVLVHDALRMLQMAPDEEKIQCS